MAPKAKHGLNTYLEHTHAQEIQQIKKNMELRVYRIKQDRKIQKKKDEIKEYDRLLKILQEAISYSHKTLRKKDITPTEAQEVRKNILDESIRLMPIIKEKKKIANQELEKLTES
jgi:enoyl-[acyl-carrier-protein] reductase (NADH)